MRRHLLVLVILVITACSEQGKGAAGGGSSTTETEIGRLGQLRRSDSPGLDPSGYRLAAWRQRWESGPFASMTARRAGLTLRWECAATRLDAERTLCTAGGARYVARTGPCLTAGAVQLELVGFADVPPHGDLPVARCPTGQPAPADPGLTAAECERLNVKLDETVAKVPEGQARLEQWKRQRPQRVDQCILKMPRVQFECVMAAATPADLDGCRPR